MNNNHSDFLFVHFDYDGKRTVVEDDRFVRSHVQRSIVRRRKNRPAMSNLSFVHIRDGKVLKEKYKEQEASMNGDQHASINSLRTSGSKVSNVTGSHQFHFESVEKDRSRRSLALHSIVSDHITDFHPWTPLATKFVQLPRSQLDHLFKSSAFRTAAEPLFDTSHVDATRNMLAVFPRCDSEPVFFNALAFGVLQVLNRGTLTTESLSVMGRTVRLLNERINSCKGRLSPPVIGAIMILKSISYKFQDHVSHKMHTQGLNTALKLCNNHSLTEAAERAVFWLDLFATVLIGSKRQLSHSALPHQVHWQREDNPRVLQQLPTAFIKYENVLPIILLECVADIVELQTLVDKEQMTQLLRHAQHYEIDNMQASIESRLVFATTECNQSVFSEAMRLGIFLCCYCSWMETWNSSLIPCRLVEKLIAILNAHFLQIEGRSNSLWMERIESLLWLLLVTSVVVEMNEGLVEDLRSQHARLMRNVQCILDDFSPTEQNHALLSALKDFIYCDEWLVRRHRSVSWLQLEMKIESKVRALS